MHAGIACLEACLQQWAAAATQPSASTPTHLQLLLASIVHGSDSSRNSTLNLPFDTIRGAPSSKKIRPQMPKAQPAGVSGTWNLADTSAAGQDRGVVTLQAV